jgi:hypothetical protein
MSEESVSLLGSEQYKEMTAANRTAADVARNDIHLQAKSSMQLLVNRLYN